MRVMMLGLGPMGANIAKLIIDKKGVEIIGAIDVDKDIVGSDLGEILGMGKAIGVTVVGNLEKELSKTKAELAIIATRSHLKAVFPQITACVKAGLNVISTCEELVYPYSKYPTESEAIDAMAKASGVTVLGTGINPGYLMDTLPTALTATCQQLRSIKVTRMMNSSKRRMSYQKKIGTGLAQHEFKELIKQGKITGHVGLFESISMIASSLRWKLDSVVEFPPEPVVTDTQVVTPFTTIEEGGVIGLRSVAHGIRNGKVAVMLEFISHASVKDEYDSILIDGVPSLSEKIVGGVHGDLGTAAVVVNMIPQVLNAEPGLVTMKDLPLPHALTEDMRVYVKPAKPACTQK